MILDELKTMKAVAAGASLTRLNDGELGYAFNSWPHRDQPMVGSLRNRLAQVVRSDVPGLLVGIPRVLAPDNDSLPVSTKGCKRFWANQVWQRICAKVHDPAKTYGSGFVSYPDRHLPRDKWDEFRRLCGLLWQDKNVILVGQPGDSGQEHLAMIKGAASIRCHTVPTKEAWREYDTILQELTAGPIQSYSCEPGSEVRYTSTLVLIAAGLTGTVLAHDLHVAGYHAVDIGRLLLRLKIMEEKR